MPYIHQLVNPDFRSHELGNSTLNFVALNNLGTTENQDNSTSTWITTSTATSATTTPIPTPSSTRASSPTNSIRLGILPSINISTEDLSAQLSQTETSEDSNGGQSTSAPAVQEPARANPPVHVRAKFVFTPQRDTELALAPGDIVEVLEVDERGWTMGQCRGRRGWFPITYTMDVDAEEREQREAGVEMGRNSV